MSTTFDIIVIGYGFVAFWVWWYDPEIESAAFILWPFFAVRGLIRSFIRALKE